MTSKTSFYKSAPFFRQNLQRNKWISIAYFLIISLIFPVNIFFSNMNAENNLSQKITYLLNLSMRVDLIILPLIAFPILFAVISFKYLTQHHEAILVHSMPVSRKRLFIEHSLSGILMTLLPLLMNGLLLTGLMLLLPKGLITLSLVLNWTFYTVLFGTAFYAISLFSVMIIGTPILQVLFIAIFMLLPAGLYIMIRETLGMVLKGFHTYVSHDWVYYSSPLTGFLGFLRLGTHSPFPIAVIILYIFYGVLFTTAAYYLYRKRPIENIGQTVQIEVLAPLLKYLATFCSMLLCGLFIQSLTNYTPMLLIGHLIGGIIGYMVSEMAIQKSFRCHYKIKPLLIFITIFFIGFGIISTDLIGYGSKKYATEDIEAVSFNRNYFNSANFEEYNLLKSPETIQAVQTLYSKTTKSISPLFWMNNKNNDTSAKVTLYFGFINKNGQRFERYLIVNESDVYQEMSSVYKTKEFVYSKNPILQTDFAKINSLVFYNRLNTVTISNSKLIVKLLKAYELDLNEYFLSSSNNSHESTYNLEASLPPKEVMPKDISPNNQSIESSEQRHFSDMKIFPFYQHTNSIIESHPEFQKIRLNASHIKRIDLKKVDTSITDDPNKYINKFSKDIISISDPEQINAILRSHIYSFSSSANDYLINAFTDDQRYPIFEGFIRDFKK